jgi:hypothetical protein
MTRKHPRSTGSLWARFRFSVVGSLLSSPPARGALGRALSSLAEKAWSHPVTGRDFHVAAGTIARCYHRALRQPDDPVGTLRCAARKDCGKILLAGLGPADARAKRMRKRGVRRTRSAATKSSMSERSGISISTMGRRGCLARRPVATPDRAGNSRRSFAVVLPRAVVSLGDRRGLGPRTLSGDPEAGPAMRALDP